ncbi:MAG: D-alanyl-D-alanine carboxypeptidase family protein [Betaproteobacteria bacterium]|nr:D-alanyl-D-alanine carboxypeptidase family protein [Betaproteobacteria bacterium]
MLEGNARAARFYEGAGFLLDAGKTAPYPIAGQTLALAFYARENLQTLDAADLQSATQLASARGLARQAEALVLERVAVDAAGREFFLSPEAAAAWRNMQAAAAAEGVILEVLSAFRSEARQREIVAAKRAAGEALVSILRVCAAPGFSEHHRACAVDVGSPDAPPLEEDFEQSGAFAWLTRHAAEFGFALSYPRDNPLGYQFEPWHWCYHASL